MTYIHTPINIIEPRNYIPDNHCYVIGSDYTPPPIGVSYARCRYTNTFHVYEKDVIIGQALRIYGEYTQHEIEVLSLFINENSIVYDIGSNIGYHSLGFSQKAKHVYCFEPNHKNLYLLKLNTKNRDNVTIYENAVSDSVRTAYISDYELDDHGNYGECMLTDIGQECTTVRIDDLNLPHPHVVKIDVEGHELSVFNGMRETIRNSKPVILYEAMHGTGFDEIYDFLHTELDYNIYWFCCMNYNKDNYNGVSTNIFGNGGVFNCLAIPKSLNVEVKGLEPMTDRNDTYQKFIERMQTVRQ